MEKPKLYKIRVRNTKESEFIQQEFISDGYQWSGESVPQYLDKPFLYFIEGDNDITYGESESFFEDMSDTYTDFEIKILMDGHKEILQKYTGPNKYKVGEILLAGYYEVRDHIWLNMVRTQHIKNQ